LVEISCSDLYERILSFFLYTFLLSGSEAMKSFHFTLNLSLHVLHERPAFQKERNTELLPAKITGEMRLKFGLNLNLLLTGYKLLLFD